MRNPNIRCVYETEFYYEDRYVQMFKENVKKKIHHANTKQKKTCLFILFPERTD